MHFNFSHYWIDFTFIKIHQQKPMHIFLTKWFGISTERFWCVVLSIGKYCHNLQY